MIFKNIYGALVLPIQVLLSEAYNSTAVTKKLSLIPCPEGKDLKVLNLPSNLHQQSPDVAATSVP